MNNSFAWQEQACSNVFDSLGEVYHICSAENHPVIFKTEKDFKLATSLVGLAFCYYPNIHLIAFQIMGNHLHFIVYGYKEDIEKAIDLLCDLLKRQTESFPNFSCDLNFSYHRIEDLKYLRNSIAYVHRNSFLAMPDTTPYSYRWGTNLYYFNEELCRMARTMCKHSAEKWRRNVSRRRIFDEFDNVLLLSDYVCPLSFADIDVGQTLFRDARHYCHMLFKNVEAFAEIAESLGDTIALTDDEVYKLAVSVSKDKFDQENLMNLDRNARLAVAKKLKWDYSASKKQIHRILRIEMPVLDAIFGK